MLLKVRVARLAPPLNIRKDEIMKLIKTASLIVASALALTLTGCSSGMVKRDATQEFPIDVSSTAPAFIFPISLHGVPGDTQEVGLAISGGAVTEYGASVISGQQLYDLVGNLSWTLGENMRRQVQRDEMVMSGSAKKYATELDQKMKSLTGKLKTAGVISDPNFDFKYVIVLHVDSAGGMPIPFVTKVTAFGGLMELGSNKIVSYIEKDITLSDDGVLAQMPAEMNTIISQLLNKAEDEEA